MTWKVAFLTYISGMLADLTIFIFCIRRNTNIFYSQKIPFAGFVRKIFHCLKMPHSGSKLVLNFVDPVPIAVEKITSRER